MFFINILNCCLILINLNNLVIGDTVLNVFNEWKVVDYVWHSEQDRENALKNGNYIPENVAILDVDILSGKYKKIFVTTPIFNKGIPATLSTLSDKKSKDGSTLLQPFPNWESNNRKNCKGLTSVFRTFIDECGKLWVLDCGAVDIFTAPRQLCPPKIVVYDLKNQNKIVDEYVFPASSIDFNSLLITIVVDTRDAQCTKQYAYVADVGAFKMLIYDAQTKDSYAVHSNYFFPNPNHATFNISNVEFDLPDGLFTIALGPLLNNDRAVYFHSLASIQESLIPASTLLNKENFENTATPTKLFQISTEERTSQSSIEVITKSGIMFFPTLASNSLVCWNTRRQFKQKRFITIYKNDETFQFLTGMKLIQDRYLYIVTSRLQNYIIGNFSTNQISYRILLGDISKINCQ